MRNVTSDTLHDSVGSHACSVYWKRTQHTNSVALEENSPSAQSVLVLEHCCHCGVFKVP